MKHKFKSIVVVLLLFGFSTIAHAEAPKWQVDKAHAGIYFSINHIYSKVNGYFQDYEGQIYFDPDNLKESRFIFTVKVDSINTNNTKRDGHLRSEDFFGAKKYPEMRFESTAITHVNGNQYMVEGTMTIKDVSKKLKLPFTFFGTKPNPLNPKQEVAGFELLMTIDRLAYNVGNGKYLKMGVVGKDVDVMISIEATRKK